MSSIKLSICIPTFNRANVILETLESITPQLTDKIEVVIVDGNSTDKTLEVLDSFKKRSSQIKVFTSDTRLGLDKDMDRAVEYARGEFCWIFPDDDIISFEAVQKIMPILRDNVDVIALNAEVRNDNLSRVLVNQILPIKEDLEFSSSEFSNFFRQSAQLLTYMGAAIVRRELWLARERSAYYGTEFLHVGVIFQDVPARNTMIFAEPLVKIRYGASQWLSRGFDIWSRKWPTLIHSFQTIPTETKEVIISKDPSSGIPFLMMMRAKGWYTKNTFYELSKKNYLSRTALIGAYLIMLCPRAIASAIVSIGYLFVLWPKGKLTSLHFFDVLPWFSQFLGRRV